MTDKEKIHQILSSLWKNDDSVGKVYYNQALQDAQTAIDLQEEPVSEGFEDALTREWQGYNDRGAATVDALEDNTQELAFAKGFYRGAKWQKVKDEYITEDLGEYINELSKQFPEVSFAKLSRIAVRVAKWQKEQMMAKAIDGVVTFDYYDSGDKTYGCVAHDSFCLEDFGLKDRDKVKVIVIKED